MRDCNMLGIASFTAENIFAAFSRCPSSARKQTSIGKAIHQNFKNVADHYRHVYFTWISRGLAISKFVEPNIKLIAHSCVITFLDVTSGQNLCLEGNASEPRCYQ